MWLDCVLPSELCYDFDALINHGFYGEHIEETVWKKKTVLHVIHKCDV